MLRGVFAKPRKCYGISVARRCLDSLMARCIVLRGCLDLRRGVSLFPDFFFSGDGGLII